MDSDHAAAMKSSRAMIRLRREALVNLLYRNGRCDVHQLARETGVSTATVRRDLAALESQGVIDRRWGSAAMRAEVNYRDAFVRRSGSRDRDKQSLALAATEMVTPNMVIGLSGGTTCTQLAWCLWNRPTNIVTNAVNIAIELHTLRQAKVILTGGALKANSYELVGTAADAIIRNYNIEMFFFSCSGVSERGYTRRDHAEAAVVRTFMSVSSHNVMLIDDTKFGRDHAAFVAGFGEVDTVLCNDRVPSEWLERLGSEGADVRVIGEASSRELEVFGRSGVSVR